MKCSLLIGLAVVGLFAARLLGACIDQTVDPPVSSTGGQATATPGAGAGGEAGAGAGGSGGAMTGGAPSVAGSAAAGEGGLPEGTGGLREPEPDPGLTSAELVMDMSPGWNLGNTLDSCTDDPEQERWVSETYWGNPRATEELFLALKEDGIRAIRIPVTWRHFIGPGPDYTIDAAWMNRVEEVVNYAVDNDMYAILNLHHDGGSDSFAWLGDTQDDYESTMEKFRAVWLQIAERFQNHPHRLVFESMNEVTFPELEQTAGNAAAYALLNDMNQHFVDWIRASGSTNETRHLLLAGYAADIRQSVAGWEVPEDPADRSVLSVHYYTPWRFCITADRTTWGTAGDLDELTGLFDQLETTFIDNGVPVILGEYGVVFQGPEPDSRILWVEHVTKAAHDRGIAPFLWDNGEEVDRTTYEWRTDGLLEAILRASSGEDYEITQQ